MAAIRAVNALKKPSSTKAHKHACPSFLRGRKVEKAQGPSECQKTLQEAFAKNNVQLLKSSQALQCAFPAKPKEYFIDALKELGTPRAKRVASEIAAIAKMPFKRHKLDPIDMLAISIWGEYSLDALDGKTKAVYKRGSDISLARSIVIDPRKQTFTILSKKYGDLNAEGAFKRVTDAIEVSPSYDTATARRVVHVRNKAEEHISTTELVYEKAYGKIITWTRYKSKKRPHETKTLIVQEAFDHDLYLFTEYTPEHLRKKIDFRELLTVLEDVGSTLNEMHKDGVVHRDVKAKNVLFRKSQSGKVQAKLIDFGHTYVPDTTNCLRKRKKGYGTLRYTAPDLLEHPLMKANPLELAKAEDAYALGQLIYEVYLQQATPWGSITYRALKKKEDAEENRKTAIRLQKEEAETLAQESKSRPHTTEKELLGIISRLLDPNPLTRMQISEFMTALYNLKAKYDTLAAVKP